MVRSSKPPLASLGRCLVTASVKRRQSGCRVAMLVSPEILQRFKGRRSLTMRKATSRYALCEYIVALTGSQSQQLIPRTNSKRFRKSLKEMNLWLKHNRNIPLKELTPRLNQKLVGHYRYYGVSCNVQMLVKYYYYVVNMLFKWLNRRARRKASRGSSSI